MITYLQMAIKRVKFLVYFKIETTETIMAIEDNNTE